jgi:hypothetical protein
MRRLLCLGLFALPFCAGTATERTFSVIVAAGEFDREQTVVSFPLPDEAREYRTFSRPNGTPMPFQVDAGGRGWFVLNRLKAGATRTLKLAPGKLSRSADAVKAQRAGGTVQFTTDGKAALTYQAEKSEPPRPDIPPLFQRGGYLHPVFSPSGKVVTDSYAPNHIHQHGIWFAWTKTEFQGRQPDFWNMGQGKGTVEFVALSNVWSGPVHAGLVSTHRFVDLTASEPVTALHEIWEVQVFAVGRGAKAFHMFDLTSTQRCATSAPLKLPKYHYGGMGFRGPWEWNGPENAFFLTSEGETNRIAGNESRGRWCHIGGMVDGELTGIAVLSHPENFRAPQPMRLHPKEPYISFAPQQLGEMEIAPGTTYVSRYRFVVADGAPDKEFIERLWRDYAHPVAVQVIGGN